MRVDANPNATPETTRDPRALPGTRADGASSTLALPGEEEKNKASSASLCAACPHVDFLADGHCQPGEICVRARSGRQIDRFFGKHPGEARRYLDDAFWERRAIACRYVPLACVYARMRDADEIVRRVVASRLPPERLVDMARDPAREVRLMVAQRLPLEKLALLVDDMDYRVRVALVERLPHGQLLRFARDPEREVRKIVARRLPAFALDALRGDPEPEIRAIAASRALPQLAARFLSDPDWWVRFSALPNAPLECLADLRDDTEAEIRAAARARLEGGGAADGAI
jgi:hypothetical protein